MMEILNINNKRYLVNYRTDENRIVDINIIKKRTNSSIILKNDNIYVFADEIIDATYEEIKTI